MKKIIAIILIIVAVGGVGAGIGAAVVYNAPENVAIGAVKGAFADLVERDEVAPVWNMLHGGSVYVSVDKFKSDDYDQLEGGHASGKVYFSDNAIMAEDVDVDLFGLELEGGAYISDECMYISEDKILDGEYGIVYKELARDFEDSIFAYGSKSDYAIEDKKTYNTIMDMLETLEEDNELKKDVEELTTQHTKSIWDIICDNAEFGSESDEVRLNGEKCKVRVVTIKMDAKDISNIVRDTYDYLCDDKTIGDFLDKYAQSLTVLYGDDSDSIGELYEEYLEDMEDVIDNLCDEIEDIDELDDIQINIITPKMSHKLLKLEVEADGDTLFSVDFGKEGLKKTEEISVEILGEEMSYVITENTKDSYEAEFEYDAEGIFMEISIDKKKESYTLILDNGYSEYEIKGNYIEDGDTTTITVSKVTESWTSWWRDGSEKTDVYKADITIIIDEKDKMPTPSTDFDRISDIKEKDVDKWVEKLEEIF